ncbi:hypothetical protein M378DRAFT_18256 [Amanita muscaria Koide BX008]|uniref:Uncharacterized protein n=1 Tax=Amanita muscaria (strain Koide BX008) TaxID=946122 RepID=A0A0C2RXP7_AMAMK|nr:hypothetical protein M378DRAFT_18256 [Amanita muscaria Koide BX008]
MEFAHNQQTHEARHMSPFKLITSAPAVEKRLEELKNFREEALAVHELNKQ